MAQDTKQAQPQKKQHWWNQIAQVYRFTHEYDKQLPWWMLGVFLLPIVIFIILGIIFHWGVFSWIMFMITAVLLGFLFAIMILSRRTDAVGYQQLEGRPGASVSILRNMSKGGYTFPEEPVWVDPKTKDAIWRGTSYNGIYLVGEGNYGRLQKAMDRQEREIKGVTAGSAIPVYRICVGNGENQVKLKDLRKTVTKCKSYTPSSSKNALWKKIHPKNRFLLAKTELNQLNERLRTLQRKNGYGIPKGIDPTRAQRTSRRAMRGR